MTLSSPEAQLWWATFLQEHAPWPPKTLAQASWHAIDGAVVYDWFKDNPGDYSECFEPKEPK